MNSTREDALVEEIDKAFAGVQLEDGVSLNMTEYNDSSGMEKHYAVLAQDDERNDWHAVEGATLQEFTVTFSFTDLKGFRFYLPAYMIWTIRNHRTSDSIISDHTIYAIDPDHYLFKTVPMIDWFTEPQLTAMIHFLKYASDNDNTLDGVVARENWLKILTRLKA